MPKTTRKHTSRAFGVRYVLVMAPSLAILLVSQMAVALELSDILSAGRVSPPARVAFEEERHNALFDAPLRLSGYLEYLEPGVLHKVVESPFQESFLVEADRILIVRGGETRALPIKRSKELAAILGAIEAILAGDTARIESVFEYQVLGTEDSWFLDLKPHSRKVGRHLDSIRVSGDDRSIGEILINLRGGEWHLMSIIAEEAPK